MKALIDWIETLEITQGPAAGEPFVLLPWQKRWLMGSFRPSVTESALTIGRGGGKSTLCGAVGAAAVAGPLVRPREDCIVVAASFAGARVIYEAAVAFIRPTRAEFKWQDSANSASLERRDNGARLLCIASDPKNAHGKAPQLVLCDEGAQWKHPSGERMIAAQRTSLGKTAGGKLLAIGTRPDSETHWFSRMLDGGADYCQIHAASPTDPPFQQRTMMKANPSLRAMPELLEATRREADKAKRDDSLLASYLALRLNLGTADTVIQVLIDAEAWAAAEGDADRKGPVVFGIDLGGTAAQSAVAGFWPETGRLEAVAAFPAEPTLTVRGVKDAVGDLYVRCARRGELVTLGGHTVPVGQLLAEAMTRFGRPSLIAADRWRDGELLDAMNTVGLRCPIDWRGQGFKDGAADVRLFRRHVMNRKVTPLPQLIMRAAMGEARTVTDKSANTKLAKSTEGGRRQSARDDVAAAAILAVSLGARQPPPRVGTGAAFAIAR